MTILQQPAKTRERDLFNDLSVDLAMLAASVSELEHLTSLTDKDAGLVQNVGHNLDAVLSVYQRVYGLVKVARIDAQASVARDRVVKDGMAGWPIPTQASVCERVSNLGRYVDERA